MPTDPSAQRSRLQAEAEALGFHAFGVAAVPLELRRAYFRQWLAEGQHGTMDWMGRNPERRLHPEHLVEEARSLIVVGLNYYQPDPERPFRIAKYALGDDYHNLILKRLKKLCRIMRDEFGGVQRPYVDTGPLLEKPIAEAAGIGWQGKSTILVEPGQGTWSFLGVIVTDLDLPPDEPGKDRCGSCTRCIDCCPTGAITAPYQLDARRCIAYLTIEHEGPIPLDFREAIGDRLFGCDECLDVCPWNKWARQSAERRFSPRSLPPLVEMLEWDEVRFGEAFAGSPMRRLKLGRLQRNICIVLGNVGGRDVVEPLRRFAERANGDLAEQAHWAVQRIVERQTEIDHVVGDHE